ncbi:Sensors of blue-light using FAD [Allochromatium warmingii]|uniref:Sensors of blue-light using FAD n=1 Tax=Allochromatium warmingii TaxID=61595 RepID=A0A1H3EJM6_ALLWA|nr:BLUF domain-containing protein [Allochromatium warmingii]SDX78820.1 Sensors of blue-light using FAD [Allochromatium warmingii]
MPLIHIIYMSTAHQTCSDADLKAILDSSARQNAENGITGMLLYTDGCFIQVLEGEATAVEETYARVARDGRHYGLIELERGEIAERSFANWSMGFKQIAAEEIRRHPNFAPFFECGFTPESIGAHRGLAFDLLLVFARNQ